MVDYAARELQRYLYLRSGELPRLRHRVPNGPAVVLGVKASPILKGLTFDVADLAGESYALVNGPSVESARRSVGASGTETGRYTDTAGTEAGHYGRTLYIVGGSELGVLYGAYRFCEHLGIRFYLHGDVIPDDQTPITLPEIHERRAPLFSLRGIQPFHDFPEGPDWWDGDDYKAIIAQLPKLGMNFFGLHTYPEDRPNAEPTLWIGAQEGIAADGRVRFGYPSSYYTTALNASWGFAPKKTSAYACGGALLFPEDDFGSEIMRGFAPKPNTAEEYLEVFERTGALFREAFTLARSLGIKTCIGTETPLVVPKLVQEHLAGSQVGTKDLYLGMFSRIMKTHPLDYYWLWTPENWTWENVKEETVAQAVQDILAAKAALGEAGEPFALATCGWVLGPQYDRAYLDKILPKDISVSCISRAVGHDPVEPGFATVQGREKWAIPWLEDDPAMTSVQLWAGRMRRDARDALQYGCTGLMGIHWRTHAVAPNVAAVAQAAWDQSGWPTGGDNSANSPQSAPHVPAGDFYLDWARAEFGADIGAEAARILTMVDGRLPRPSDWVTGPGGYRPDPRPWTEVAPEYAFIDEFATLRGSIVGPGNLARFDYWWSQFEFLRATARMRCVWASFNGPYERMKQETETEKKKRIASEEVLPRYVELVEAVQTAYRHLLNAADTTGELGTVCNLEQHLFPGLLEGPRVDLETVFGAPLGELAQLGPKYAGAPRLIVLTKRGSVAPGEPLEVETIVLSAAVPRQAQVFWKPIGKGSFQSIPMPLKARRTYTAELPAVAKDKSGIEYYLETTLESGETLHWPATAPSINQTVIVESFSIEEQQL
ncbi:MAG: hypothetical protein HYZ00_08145 [Candidatus Hydrogenedentes bacterium]|nr:hypothetical protein [Candidatus Hydrogenedentota bacterium]